MYRVPLKYGYNNTKYHLFRKYYLVPLLIEHVQAEFHKCQRFSFTRSYIEFCKANFAHYNHSRVKIFRNCVFIVVL